MVVARLRSLLGAAEATPPPAARVAAMPEGERVYAIGDVHGRLDLLETLLDWIDADNNMRGEARTTLVFLGDLVDRGPHSAQVIEHVLSRDWKGRVVRHLQGNHEEVMLQVLDGDIQAVRFWLKIGGTATLRSYGVPAALLEEGASQQIAEDFAARVPREHIAFLKRMEDHITIGDYAFVHAGVRPGLALNRQKSADLRWIRNEFLDHAGDHGKVIVHGHSISDKVDGRANRIGIDTGAYATGKLTALLLEGKDRRFLST